MAASPGMGGGEKDRGVACPQIWSLLRTELRPLPSPPRLTHLSTVAIALCTRSPSQVL